VATAKKSGRRRSGARGGEKLYEFEGLIRSASPESIVVFTSHQVEVTIALAPETIIRKGQTALTAADLTVDTRVHVKARLANDAYTAALVIVQNPAGEDDGEDEVPAVQKEYEGRVVAATADTITVFTSKKVEVTFTITDQTVIRRGSATFDMRQILIGMLVHVKATPNADGTNTANLIIVQNTNVKVTIEGTVASITGTSLVVTTADGDMTVNTSNSTQIRKAGAKIALSDVAVGDSVKVEGTLTDVATVQAKKITVGG
jgi:RNase P/RNase MRP subunit p29